MYSHRLFSKLHIAYASPALSIAQNEDRSILSWITFSIGALATRGMPCYFDTPNEGHKPVAFYMAPALELYNGYPQLRILYPHLAPALIRRDVMAILYSEKQWKVTILGGISTYYEVKASGPQRACILDTSSLEDLPKSTEVILKSIDPSSQMRY